jgi:hypothetical protein
LSGVATALAALAGHECAYLPAALSTFQPAPPPAASPASLASPNSPASQLDQLLAPALERLYLLYEAHTRQHFLTDAPQFNALLAARLSALGALVQQHHGQLAAGDPQRGENVQQALRQGYHMLLAPS